MGREHSVAFLCQTNRKQSRPFYGEISNEQQHFRDHPAAESFPRRPRISMPQPKPSPTAWKRWELTHFTEAASTATTKARSVMTHLPPDAVAPPPTFADEEIARLREAARQEGYQAGFDSGREAAAATGHELAARLGQAISRFDSGVSQLEQVRGRAKSARPGNRNCPQGHSPDNCHEATGSSSDVIREALAANPLAARDHSPSTRQMPRWCALMQR
jgi:hypothetical protein